jgi:hypothetical protein
MSAMSPVVSEETLMLRARATWKKCAESRMEYQRVRFLPRRSELSSLAAVRPLWLACQNIFEVTIISIIAACTSVQTQENTLEQIATLEQIRYSQILTNSAQPTN